MTELSRDRDVLISGAFIVQEAREAVREFFRPITASIAYVLQSAAAPGRRTADGTSDDDKADRRP